MKQYKTGYVQGTFDLFHVGHLNLLKRAKDRCDWLIVGVVSDKLNVQYKNVRPYIPYEERAAVVAGCRYVDEVICVNVGSDNKLQIWEQHPFDCHFCGDDHGDWGTLIEDLRKRGSNVEFFPYTEATSSTKIKEELKRRILYHEDDVHTFDVFDTLITRTTASPVGIFAIVQRELHQGAYQDIPAHVRDGFFDLRIFYERRVRAEICNEVCEDITLDEIYDDMARQEGLSAAQRGRLITLERAVEVDCSRGIPCNIERVKKLLSSGHKVYLISDMYMDEATLRQMLVKADSIFANLPLYISSACRMAKGTGNLYRYVQRQENLDVFHWVHTGDNKQADGERARELGIKTVYYNGAALTRRENALVQRYADRVDMQLRVGAIRWSRIVGPAMALDEWNERPDEEALPYGIANHYPVGCLKERLVLYGAGKLGQGIYEKLLAKTSKKVVCWVDKNAASSQKHGFCIERPDRLRAYDFDEVVIAVANEQAAREIQQFLLTLGIPKDKMVWIARHFF